MKPSADITPITSLPSQKPTETSPNSTPTKGTNQPSEKLVESSNEPSSPSKSLSESPSAILATVDPTGDAVVDVEDSGYPTNLFKIHPSSEPSLQPSPAAPSAEPSDAHRGIGTSTDASNLTPTLPIASLANGDTSDGTFKPNVATTLSMISWIGGLLIMLLTV